MKTPSTVIAPCPMCHVPLVVPLIVTGTHQLSIAVDQKFLRAHAEGCLGNGHRAEGDEALDSESDPA